MEERIDFKEITRFIDVLGKSKNDIRLRAFPHKHTPLAKKKGRARKFSFCQTEIVHAQESGLGIYIVINKGGDNKESINQCIAYFAEFDGISEDKQHAAVKTSGLPKPSMVVQTGGGSLHFYWVLFEPLTDKRQWQADMKRLVAHLGSDTSINDPSRVMRLPGCLYMDGNGQPVAQVQIIHESNERFTREQIISCLPEQQLPQKHITLSAPSIQSSSDQTEQRAIDQLRQIPPRIPGEGTRDKYRGLFWGLVAICGANRASQLMAQHSPQWASQEDLQKLAADGNGEIGPGTFFEIAKRAWGITSPKSQGGYSAVTPVEIQQAETIDDLLGPVEEGKLRKPRTDMLTKVLELVLPLRFNRLTQRIENEGRSIDGDFLGTLYLQLAERFQIDVVKERACDAAILLARRNAFHPVQDYLAALPNTLDSELWESIAQHVFDVADPLASIHLRRQLIGLVARAMQPGCKLDTALVIYSPEQGIGKSTLWAILGGPWFSDSLGDLRNLKDDVLQLHSSWIHEWGEIDAVMGKRESEMLKKFLSATKDDVRKPYGRGVETLVRSCGIVGTTNRSDFIKDPTGNRRFPVISVEQVNNDWVQSNRDAIWGSALADFKAGIPWHYDSAENSAITLAAQNYAAEDPLRDQIESWMDDNPHTQSIAMPVLIYHLNADLQRNAEFSRQIALRLTSLGWRKSDKRERGYLPDGNKHDKATVWY